MQHHMNLSDDPFEQIKNGTKTLELRLYDEKRQKLDIGDTIIFSNSDSTIETEIVGLSRFASFLDLFITLGGVKAGWSELDTPEKMTQDMRKYYSEDGENKYGVLGIHIKLT